jgi:hypothetical protein
MTVRAAALLALLLLPLTGCGTTAITGSSAVGEDASADTAAADTTAADTAAADTAPADTAPIDTSPPPPREAPPLATPTRSAATEALYCGLSNGQLVQGALRGAACLNLPAAAFLDDLSRGMFYGNLLLAGYLKATFGSCEFVQCLNDATTCEQARECDAARLKGPCDAGRVGRCDGSTLEACLYDGLDWRWYATTDCERVGAACVERVCPNGACLPTATCVREPMIQFCDYYGRCDGDNLVRCMPNDGASSYSLEVTLDCGDLMEGGTCIETPVGGEVPGPACVAPEPDCINAFGGSSCESDRELSICLFGRKTTVDCAAYGYDRCDEGVNGFASRCLP